MEIQDLLQHIFKTPSLEDVPLTALQQLTDKHPYFSAARFMLVKKMQLENHADYAVQVQKANLYFHDPLWMHYLLNKKTKDIQDTVENIIPTPETATEEVTVPLADIEEEFQPVLPVIDTVPDNNNTELVFDPYHTIDYFASLGIKLSQEVKEDDKLGRQLKSFTQWLKTMRKLPESAAEAAQIEAVQTDQNAHIEKIAAHSLVEKEILTEAMAEVLVMQGKKDKAAGLYHKLSLLNPDKSAYFAAKINDLNLL